MNERRLSDTLRDQIAQFSEKLSSGLKRPQRKFVFQMLFGLLGAQDIKLSSIARAVHENIELIKTENRLSRQTKTAGLASHITGRLIQAAIAHLKQDTVLAIDVSDLSKPYAEKMECLARVSDDSQDHKLTNGYWLPGVASAEVAGEQLIPLRMALYSRVAASFAEHVPSLVE